MIRNRITMKKYGGLLTAALRPMFSTFGNQSRKRLKIHNPQTIRGVSPQVAAKEIFTISKAS